MEELLIAWGLGRLVSQGLIEGENVYAIASEFSRIQERRKEEVPKNGGGKDN